MGMTSWVPDRIHLSLMYRAHLGKRLNLSNPQTYNEKLQWLKLYDRKHEYTQMADKYAAKQWVACAIGGQYVIPALGKWKSANEINLQELPNQFVLKTNHDSGGVVICRDKNSFDFEKAKKFLSKHLKSSYFPYGREWPYKNIEPCVFAEEYLPSELGGSDVPDFKILCFDGSPKYIELHQNRSTRHTQDWYDAAWNLLDINQDYAVCTGKEYPKPVLLDKMLELSSKLSCGIPHLRVDWFVSNGRLYLGELTFFDGSGFVGFNSYKDDLMLGECIRLPNVGTGSGE